MISSKLGFTPNHPTEWPIYCEVVCEKWKCNFNQQENTHKTQGTHELKEPDFRAKNKVTSSLLLTLRCFFLGSRISSLRVFAAATILHKAMSTKWVPWRVVWRLFTSPVSLVIEQSEPKWTKYQSFPQRFKSTENKVWLCDPTQRVWRQVKEENWNKWKKHKLPVLILCLFYGFGNICILFHEITS